MVSTSGALKVAVGVPAAILVLTHLKSLPLAYTLRSWWLLRALVKRAKARNLEPERRLAGPFCKKDNDTRSEKLTPTPSM